MMQVHQNFQLRNYNTFGVAAIAKQFATFASVAELEELLSMPRIASINSHPLILGGGSNVLFTTDCLLVLKNEIPGITIEKEDNDYVYVRAGAGESWHNLVLYCVNKNFGGIENLSLIPGSAGASPIQNIGAYGVELQDVFHQLNAFHLKEKQIVSFNAVACEFGYRQSIFKEKYRNLFVILDLTIKLRKSPLYNTSYVALQKELERMMVRQLSVDIISKAVINIRKLKLPDPKVTGNAGSFFKNPEISLKAYEQLLQRFPAINAFLMPNGLYKVAAGWLTEQCGFKGFRKGDAGCYHNQALVLVNYGEATGQEIFSLSEEIIQAVFHKFNVILQREVNII